MNFDTFLQKRRADQIRLKVIAAFVGLLLGCSVTIMLLSIVSPFVGVQTGSKEYWLLLASSLLAFSMFYALGYSLGSVRLYATFISLLATLDPVERRVFKEVLESAIAQEEKNDSR